MGHLTVKIPQPTHTPYCSTVKTPQYPVMLTLTTTFAPLLSQYCPTVLWGTHKYMFIH